MSRIILSVIAAALLIASAQAASAQSFGGSGDAFGQLLPSAPSVHLLLGRQPPAHQFVLRSYADYLSRNGEQLYRMNALPQQNHSRETRRSENHPVRFFALPQPTYTRQTHRHSGRR